MKVLVVLPTNRGTFSQTLHVAAIPQVGHIIRLNKVADVEDEAPVELVEVYAGQRRVPDVAAEVWLATSPPLNSEEQKQLLRRGWKARG
jgi:hypothetical protein